MERRDFFISYQNRDEAWAVWIARVLKKNGYTVYAQALDIRPGDDFLEKMEVFLENSDNFIAVWSENYAQSKYCMKELRSAYHQWNDGRMNCLLPVKIDSYPVKALYSALVRVDLSGMGTASETKLIEEVRHAVSRPRLRRNVTRQILFGGDSRKLWRYLIIGFCFAVALLCVETHEILSLWEENTAIMRELTEDGLYHMGNNYHGGINGVDVNYKKARKYYEQAAAKGNASALNGLGLLYRQGLGVEADYIKARKYYEQAAAKGNASALYNLGFLYEYGYGVDIDYAKALDYYQQAADAGYEKAAAKVEEMQEKLNAQSG